MALGLVEPWQVADVQMDMELNKVTIVVKYAARGAAGATIHGYEERRWRHLDTMQFETIIQATVPRIRKTDGSTEMLPVPWAESKTRWTLMFEAFAIRVIQNSRSLTQACALLKLDWEGAHRIMERAVDRGMERRQEDEVRTLGIDEKSFKRGQSYITTLVDLNPKQPRVLEVGLGRDCTSAKTLLKSQSKKMRKQIEAVAMDMSASYAKAVNEVLPKADIVHDRFHVSKLLGEAMDKVRRGEQKELAKLDDKTLNGTRFFWLFHPKELDEKRLQQVVDLFQMQHLKTARAYYYRLRFMDFWEQPDIGAAQRFFTQWYHEAKMSGLDPILKVAETLKVHLGGLLTYFRHKITNAMSEGFNSMIQSIKASARGFRNFENYRIRILFFLGRLELEPR